MVTYASIYKSCIVRRWCLVARILTQGWKGRAPGIVQWLTPLVVPWPPAFLFIRLRVAPLVTDLQSRPVGSGPVIGHVSLPLSRSRFRTVTARPSRKCLYRSENVIVAIRLAEFVVFADFRKGATRSLWLISIFNSLFARGLISGASFQKKIHSYLQYWIIKSFNCIIRQIIILIFAQTNIISVHGDVRNLTLKEREEIRDRNLSSDRRSREWSTSQMLQRAFSLVTGNNPRGTSSEMVESLYAG